MSISESVGPITILYSDESIVVIDKPPAMLTHANSFDRTSPTVVGVLGSRLGHSVHNVHRLDRMTTGAMVLARTRDAAAGLAEQFRNRTVAKRYLAIVRGHVAAPGTVEASLTSPSDGEERVARTDYEPLATGRVEEPIGRYGEGWFSLVSLRLHTGRIHQARRHLHRINHPVIGDSKHGDKAYNRWAAARLGEKHLFLRAVALDFDHPLTGERVAVRLGVPEVWARCCEMVGIDPGGYGAPEEPVRIGQSPGGGPASGGEAS